MTDHNHGFKSVLRFLLGIILLGAAGKALAPYALAITLSLTALGVLTVIATVIFVSLRVAHQETDKSIQLFRPLSAANVFTRSESCASVCSRPSDLACQANSGCISFEEAVKPSKM